MVPAVGRRQGSARGLHVGTQKARGGGPSGEHGILATPGGEGALRGPWRPAACPSSGPTGPPRCSHAAPGRAGGPPPKARGSCGNTRVSECGGRGPSLSPCAWSVRDSPNLTRGRRTGCEVRGKARPALNTLAEDPQPRSRRPGARSPQSHSPHPGGALGGGPESRI